MLESPPDNQAFNRELCEPFPAKDHMATHEEITSALGEYLPSFYEILRLEAMLMPP